jgi:FkbM family methyltransferase
VYISASVIPAHQSSSPPNTGSRSLAASGGARRRPAQALVVPLTRRWKKGAWRLGRALGDRVLIGETLGGSPIVLSMRDHQHRAIYFYGEHEPEIATLFRRLLAAGATVFDVGANVGYFSLLARELGASVHAFEPNPRVRGMLARSASLGSGGIEVVAAACSDREGIMPLYLSDAGNTGMTSLGNRTAHEIEVKLVTLDAYAARTGPDLLKIDVEGHEREVLSGARVLLASARPIVIVETSGGETLELMRDLCYTPQRILADGSTIPHDGRLQLVGGYENICFTPDRTPRDFTTDRPRGFTPGQTPRAL